MAKLKKGWLLSVTIFIQPEVTIIPASKIFTDNFVSSSEFLVRIEEFVIGRGHCR